jgi:dTDP-4-amino-4,6-dideoxygalactose transaminase
MSGELGTVGTLSFFPTKNLGAWGDAGLIVTQDDALAERLRRLRLHGGSRQYFHEEVGTNSRLDTLQAAVLLAKLPYLAQWNEARQRNAARYTAAWAGHPAICPPRADRANDHIYHQYTIQVPQRDELQAHLKAKGIGHAVYYPLALHLQPCFAYLGYRRGSLPVTEAAMDSVISLPIYPELTHEQQDAVIEAVQSFYA